MNLKDSFRREFEDSPFTSLIILALFFSLVVFTLLGGLTICVELYLKLFSNVPTLKVL